jgi:heme oxygenase
MTALNARRGVRGAGLAARLREHVQPLHMRAERTGIVRAMLRGRADAAGYGLLLRNLLPCYAALEAGLRGHGDATLLPGIAMGDLSRCAAITTDLRRISPDWQGRLAMLPEGAAYAARVAACGGDGGRLIGHAYVRYMGDLSGGLVLEKILPPLPDGGAWQFHRFDGIGDVARYKTALRAAIDQAGETLADWAPVLNEAAAAFDYNIALSSAVQRQSAASPG